MAANAMECMKANPAAVMSIVGMVLFLVLVVFLIYKAMNKHVEDYVACEKLCATAETERIKAKA